MGRHVVGQRAGLHTEVCIGLTFVIDVGDFFDDKLEVVVEGKTFVHLQSK